MQQRQLRLGDVLDDYCPRERRITNHVVVAMVGDEVKQTRCSTCDADHQYKHAKVPRARRKVESPAALHLPPAAAPTRVVQEVAPLPAPMPPAVAVETVVPLPLAGEHVLPLTASAQTDEPPEVEGPVHRRLIRAALPRHDGQQSQARSTPDFTIRQPTGGRPNRFRPRQARGPQPFAGNRSGQTGGPIRGGTMGHGSPGGRPPAVGRPAKRHHSGRKGPK